MTDTAKLALALAAIEAAKEALSEMLHGNKQEGYRCSVCGCPWPNPKKGKRGCGCPTVDFFNIVAQLEAAK